MKKGVNKKIIVVGGTCAIEELEHFIQKIQRFAEEYQIIIQSFNAEMIYGKSHLLSAAEHALRSEKEQRMTTNSIEMELFLYASGERQIKLAIPKLGVKKGHNTIALVIIPRSSDAELNSETLDDLFSKLKIKRDDEVLKGNNNTLELFGFTKEELSTVPENKYDKLILERIALIDIIK